MISSWREFPPSPATPEPPSPEPHIWDGVTLDQNASMTKSNMEMSTTIHSMIDHMPAEQQSTFANYQKTREENGREAKVP
jgi:hypothetical protein